MFVYKIINNINGNFYIGKTNRELEKRFSEHVRDSKNGKNWCLLHKAMRKHGTENFTIHLLKICENNDDLNLFEDKFINEFKPKYNSAPGGQGGALRKGAVLSEETKEKISKSHIGKKLPQETKEKMRACRIGKKLPEKATENMIKKCAKTYIFDMNGESLIITNLNKYCRDNGLCRVALRRVLKGTKKSYKGIRRITS